MSMRAATRMRSAPPPARASLKRAPLFSAWPQGSAFGAIFRASFKPMRTIILRACIHVYMHTVYTQITYARACILFALPSATSADAASTSFSERRRARWRLRLCNAARTLAGGTSRPIPLWQQGQVRTRLVDGIVGLSGVFWKI